MGFDYYGILGVKRSCKQHEIKAAYRRLALKYNPERYCDDENMKKIFALIAEAYDVLVNHKRRAIYDQYGEEGLKKGVPGPTDFIQPYSYHGDPLRTFHEFFGTSNPYADLLDYYEKPLPIFESPLGRGYKEKDPTIIRPLSLSLEEIYKGGLKKMKIQRLVFTNETCSELKLKEKVLSIPIKPGMYPHTEIKFKEEGDQGPTRIPADVIFLTEDRPHETYIRSGLSDLLTVRTISLKEALCGITFTLMTLDSRVLRVKITDVITPTFEKVIEDEGLPLPACPTRARGNLIIRFQITFPDYLSKRSKKAFEEAFKIKDEDDEKFEKMECGAFNASMA
ncbi:PREDICTED: dnaJ homolog subfamily B member 13-like [Papilio xuthus]|uniref:DnaJ homolog subfamily B member 13-like n=1 Tax=Papilio xuthus TaxID=66420 RepID=A0A194PJH5_PAPXU|nr:PREDICTED: dnaJ homolog subfamily B member 13-like [Papilio xuthus]KPI93188.1 DnaJ-like subfamily B member 13 [Papilio xuthus]